MVEKLEVINICGRSGLITYSTASANCPRRHGMSRLLLVRMMIIGLNKECRMVGMMSNFRRMY